MKSNLPIEDSEMTSNTEFRASVWRGGTYGLRILNGFLKSKDDLELFFQHEQAILLLPDGQKVTANITKSFRSKECLELRSAKIGHWLEDAGYAPWEKGLPPSFSLCHVGGGEFKVSELRM